MKTRLLLIPLVLALAHAAWAAGTCVVTNITSTQIASESNRIADAQTVIVTLTCTADAALHTFPSTTVPLSGASTTTGLNAYNLTGYYLYQVGRTPGTTQPTASYTTTITDADGFALDLGLLTTNGSASAAQLTSITNSGTGYPIVRSALTVAITANSVNSAQITLDLIFRANNTAFSSGGSSYNPASVAITGGTVDGTVVGGTTAAAGTFTTLKGTTQIQAGTGSQSAPSYSFTASTGQGFNYRSGVTEFIYGSNDSTVQFGNGYVGLGNTSASYGVGLGFANGPVNTTGTNVFLTNTASDTLSIGPTSGTKTGILILGTVEPTLTTPQTLYSVAGTPLPSCALGNAGTRAAVSDATVATPGSAYVGSGTYTIGVECVYNTTGPVAVWNID